LIKVENIEVFNFQGALRGMRNPLESWDKSDSYWNDTTIESVKDFIIGEKDMTLALKLIKAGNEHAKFMRQIFVSMDITAPLYWWKEADTYKISTVANSTSTMHKMGSRPLIYEDFSWDKFFETNLGNITDEYIYNSIEKYRQDTLSHLNELIELWQERKDKKIWLAIIQNLPSSFNQMRTWTGNYQGLRNMYFQRRCHKLQEWLDFCEVIEELPYSELITIEK